MKCALCITAKASIRTPRSDAVGTGRLPTDRALKFNSKLEGRAKTQVLKEGDTQPGDCISVDHYQSSAPGRLPTTFGRKRQGYTCGSLFVDHASGKLFNFCQLSTNADKTIASKHKLEAEAGASGVAV